MKNKICLLAGVMALCLMMGIRSGDAKELIFNLGYGKVQVIDVATDELLPDIEIKGWGRELVFSPDKKFMYVTASRRMIHKVDLEKMKVVNTIDLHKGEWQRFVYGMDLAEDGKTAYVHLFSRKTEKGEAVFPSPVVAQIDLESGNILRSIEVPIGVASLNYIKGTKSVYAIGQDIYKIDVASRDMKITDTYAMFDRKINILPLFTYGDSGGASLLPFWIGETAGLLSIDLVTGRISESMLKNPMMVYGAIYSPDKKKAYANMDELYVIDLATNKITNTLVIPSGTTFSLSTSADGKKIYLQGGAFITIYDAETLKVVKELKMSTDGMLLRRLTM